MRTACRMFLFCDFVCGVYVKVSFVQFNFTFLVSVVSSLAESHLE